MTFFCKYVVLGTPSICNHFGKYVTLGSTSIGDFFINIPVLGTPSIHDHFCKYIVLGSVSICDLFLYYLLVMPGLNGLTHLFIVPLYLFTSVNSIL